MNPRARSAAVMAYDIVAILVSWPVAYALRFNFSIPQTELHTLGVAMLAAVPIYGASFAAFRLYFAIWRYTSVHDMRRIVLALGTGALGVPAIFAMLRIGEEVPRSVLVIQPLLLLFFMGGARGAWRVWQEGGFSPRGGRGGTPIVVLGAGTAATSLIRELSRQDTWRVAALLDDDPQKQGRQLFGYDIAGTLDDAGAVAGSLGVRHAVIAMPGAPHEVRMRAAQLCKDAGLEVRTVPSYSDLVSGRVSVSQIREIELDDLLGRDPVQLDNEGLHHFIEGKTVLVTGAGGSIGAELCRQLARFQPSRLVMLELSEFALYTIAQEFADHYPSVRVAAVVGDVKSEARIREVIKLYEPAIIFHAAAYKHVPLMERENSYQAVRNNVLGTLVVAREAQKAGVRKFVLISTDKAVNPTNVMGASKRLAEMLCQSLATGQATEFVVVRFGNVLGSTGSVIPRFRQQIMRGGPVTVTHPDMQRYFMSIPEAAQLVLQASLMGRSGEVFVLDMGQPVRIVELAKQLVRLSGFSEEDIPITFTGVRPGEKLYEELLADGERTVPTLHPKLRVAVAVQGRDMGFVKEVDAWLHMATCSDAQVKAQLSAWIAEYRPGGEAHSGKALHVLPGAES